VAVKEQNREYTFAEIERFAKHCATLILKRTSTGRQPVPVFLPKSGQSIVADIGSVYSGNGYANLDIKSRPQRLKGMLDNLNPDVIVTSAQRVAGLKAMSVRGISVEGSRG
jgi:acyl-CoA synthetase (AMP-forming)/AMP-acid ligase II